MQILESNPVVFLVEFEKAVRDNWKLQDCVEGRPSHAFIHSLNLFKGFSPEVERITSEICTIDEYDSFEFLKKLQNAVLNDFELQVESVRWDTLGRKLCKLVNKNYVEPAVYTKQQLEDMEYEVLKKIGKQADVFHRSRDIMINRIIEKQQSQQQKEK